MLAELRAAGVGSILVLAVCAWAPGAHAQCPVGAVVKVDYDLANSGYTEESDNWASWQTTPCNPPTYRYLSHTVGDGSRKGKAIWKPTLPASGYYQVRTAFRATTNRTNDADYYLVDDTGATTHESVDQSSGSGCVWADLGTAFCNPGGNCHVVLDGDDGKSDEADITTFELLSCADGPDGGAVAGRCDGIRSQPAYEVCVETDTTCAGVFTDGSGCTVYCAAAGMTCTARYGGEPGCSKEAATPLACGADNGHASDWCECEGPPLQPDSGVGGAAGAGGAGGNPGSGGAMSGGAAGSEEPSDSGGAWEVSPGSGGSSAVSDASSHSEAGARDASDGVAFDGEDSACACTVPSSRPGLPAVPALAVATMLVWRARRSARRDRSRGRETSGR